MPAVAPDHVALVGFRAVDPGEAAALGDLGLALPASAVRAWGCGWRAALASDGVWQRRRPILVHSTSTSSTRGDAASSSHPGQGSLR